ncbi:hypothetical protein [Flindersiella endophytica]
MAVIVRDLVPAFLEFWAMAATKPLDEQVHLWNAYVRQYPDVVNDATRDGGPVPDPRPALQKYPPLIDRITSNGTLVHDWICEAGDLVPQLLDMRDLDIACVSVVGLARSNAWVSQLDGRPSLLVAVEQIQSADFARLLVTHEMAHACQLGIDATAWLNDQRLGLLLFAEGFATQLTAESFPEHVLAEHLWFEPGYEQWLADCEPQLRQVAQALRALAHAENPEAEARYFTLRQEPDGIPDRIGYLIGVRVLEVLRATYSWPELARWSPDEALAHVGRALKALS